MKTLQAGQAAVSPPVQRLAEALLDTFPMSVYVLTGLTLLDQQGGQRALVDLLAVTATAVVVGIDSGRDPRAITPPRAAGRLVARAQQAAGAGRPLPVYVFWIGQAPPPNQGDDSPALPEAAAIQEYILRASAQNPQPPGNVAAQVADALREADIGPDGTPGPPTPPLRRALRALPEILDAGLGQLNPIRFVQRSGPVLPADLNKRLAAAMLDRKNHLEDVNYGKIVPNDYLVEVNEDNYRGHYQPIEGEVREQWRQRLLDALNTANSRQGRKEYRFGGRVDVQVRPVPDLPENEVRLYARIKADEAAAGPAAPAGPGLAVGRPCLEQLPGGRTWPLREGTTTIGRSRTADIFLNSPEIQAQRLMSGQHAYFQLGGGRCRLFDGSPAGKPSLNGTFVNGRPVTAGGQELRDGDVIILASVDPARPRPDTPGATGFIFRAHCG
ncbi:MAG: FHA domain-containing protein [Chloroflexi bacterium]|nr:FHA domain-containing protein [Chloroflexota bacterium]MCI0575789.1 FHA domain-containing protein [Chloroflexota bacterium]MCI0647968.1 FHA domain-containing protein [Chloroflexota bacterium]MCI0726822.1 FHA domain-containing protein [Chloroflexota bacterium]